MFIEVVVSTEHNLNLIDEFMNAVGCIEACTREEKHVQIGCKHDIFCLQTFEGWGVVGGCCRLHLFSLNNTGYL